MQGGFELEFPARSTEAVAIRYKTDNAASTGVLDGDTRARRQTSVGAKWLSKLPSTRSSTLQLITNPGDFHGIPHWMAPFV